MSFYASSANRVVKAAARVSVWSALSSRTTLSENLNANGYTMTVDLSRFPSLDVLEIRPLAHDQSTPQVHIRGSISNADLVTVGERYWIYVDGGAESELADLIKLDYSSKTALFIANLNRSIAEGRSYPIITDYWNAYVYAAVIDRSHEWVKISVGSIDAFESTKPGFLEQTSPLRPGKTRVYPASDLHGSDGVRVVERAWDHEHCVVCNARIDAQNPIGFVDKANLLICRRCHDAYAATHDLGFVLNYPSWGH